MNDTPTELIEELSIPIIERLAKGEMSFSLVIWETGAPDRMDALQMSFAKAGARDVQRALMNAARGCQDGAVCKGSLLLGSGCGRCARCILAIPDLQQAFLESERRFRDYRQLVESGLTQCETAMTIGADVGPSVKQMRAAVTQANEIMKGTRG